MLLSIWRSLSTNEVAEYPDQEMGIGWFFKRDNATVDTVDIFWLRDESLEEADKRPGPDVLAQEIVEDLEAALEQFRCVNCDFSL
jgi:hypothetical protein